jgi:hypothetical protein
MIDKGDCYAMFELLILLLAIMAIIGLIRFNEKSNADGEAYFRRVPTTIFCGTVIFRGLGMRNGGIGKKCTISCSAFRIPHSPLHVPLSHELLMKLVTESLYPCLGASPIAGINSARLVRRRDESLKWRFKFCRILLKQR